MADLIVDSEAENWATPLKWQDFSALATWMAEEIGGNYYMDKKSYQKRLPDEPFHFNYRVPVTLWHEERTLLSLFIERIFWEHWNTGKTSGFDWREILRKFAWQLGMQGYERNPLLYTLCWQFVEKFPNFIKTVKEGGG